MTKNEVPLEAVDELSHKGTDLMGRDDGWDYAYRAWLRLALSPT